jgi:hypothetical protein
MANRCERWMDDLKDTIVVGRKAYMSVSERVVNECRDVKTEVSAKPPGALKIPCPPLAADFPTLIGSCNNLDVDLDQTFRDSVRHLSVCTAALRCLLSRYVERFDISNMSDRFLRSMILQNLDCVPELLKLSIFIQGLVGQSQLLATAIHHLNRLQIFKYPEEWCLLGCYAVWLL